jgi:hypothetical protein
MAGRRSLDLAVENYVISPWKEELIQVSSEAGRFFWNKCCTKETNLYIIKI